MATRTIELKSGSIIQRIPSGQYDEIWKMENKALAVTYLTLDLSNCSGVTIDCFEGKTSVTESIQPMETKTVFMVRKTPPFSFKIGFSVQEDPIPLADQDDYLSDSKRHIQSKVEDIGAKLMGIPFDVMEVEDIAASIQDIGYDHFIDPSFPPIESSIYDASTEPDYPFDEKPVWKRPIEFMYGEPRLFEDDANPNDIRQGALGNCWFLASIAALAESPALVKRLFITEEYNEFGIYKLRICKNGEWVVVTIDDYIPCSLNGGPMFSSSNGNELWVLLLEKAYAKLHGNYWQLRAGFVSHGMMDLSGCPTERVNFPKERSQYHKIRTFADEFWSKLMEADRIGNIM